MESADIPVLKVVWISHLLDKCVYQYITAADVGFLNRVFKDVH